MRVTEPRQDEAALVAQARTDPAAFGVLYERYVRKIYTYLYYRTGNPHDAEDLTARVFQRALTHMGHYRERGWPFSAWLYRIAHNLAANWRRDASRRQWLALDQVPPADWPGLQLPGPETTLENREEQARLWQAFHQLPADRQQLLILKLVEHHSNTEIGVIMHRSEGAIKSLYHRTLLELRAALTEEL